MRVLLTGASGFIGAHVARIALDEGHEVIAQVRPGSNLSRLEAIRDHLHLVSTELGDAGKLHKALRDDAVDACLHLAWHAEPGRYLQATENLDCLHDSLELVRCLHQLDCRRLVIAGTSFEYANSTSPVTEMSPIGPTTLYAAAKHSLFLTAGNFDIEHDWSVASARIFCLYGPREDPRRLVPFVISRLLAGERCELSTGQQVRDYSHVEDVAGALWATAVSSVVGAINIGSSQPVTVASLCEQLAALVGRPELLNFGARAVAIGEPPYLVANTQRLHNEVGFKPRYNLAEGLSDTLRWWRSRKPNS